MPVSTNKLPDPAPAELSLEASDETISDLLQSPEALHVYLIGVRQRRETNRQQRRAYWQIALERLKEELQAAEEDRDAEIVAELQVVLRAFEEALASAGRRDAKSHSATVDPFAAEPAYAEKRLPQPSPLETPTPELSATATVETTAFVATREQPHQNGTRIAQEESSQDGSAASTTAEDVKAVVEAAAQQRRDEAVRQVRSGKIADLEMRITEHLTMPLDDLSSALRLRALYCEGQALAYQLSAPEKERQHLMNLLDEMAAARTPWAGDCPFALTERNPQVWDVRSRLYHACSAASQTMQWYQENEEDMDERSRIEMLNTVAAAQQRLYRSLESVHRRDDAVQELYRQIRAAGQTAGFIKALNGSASDEELSELAGRCDQVFQAARDGIEEQRAQEKRTAHKEAAIATVIAWEEALEGRAISSDSLEADRRQLGRLLDECLIAGVPPTNVKVRTAILNTAPVLLAGQASYAKFLDAVLGERGRRGLDVVEVAPPQEVGADENLNLLVKSVAEFTRSKRVVMLGGKSRPQVADELQELLECEVAWPDSDRGDKFAKFASVIKKADVVLMLKNFASHELFQGGKDAMAASGKHFVVLPSGYGVKQVLFQLSEYVAREKVTA